MTATNTNWHSKPADVVSSPAGASSIDVEADGSTFQSLMPYACQSCATRKVKCDKEIPTCSSCRKGKSECVYQAPAPRRRKRKLSGDTNDKLARYERILHQHGLFPHATDTPTSMDDRPSEPVSLRFNEPETSRTGKLLAGHGKSRYIGSHLWRNLGDEEMQRMSRDVEEDQVGIDFAGPDPLTGAFMGSQQSLLEYHPTYAEAMMLWHTHAENVEPICKILHVPSSFQMVNTVSRQPELASRADECLLFAIYHFAVFSMPNEECAKEFGQSRATMMEMYHFATRQALVNASFLKTTEIKILQALVLFLLSCRYTYDPHTYWILTGVAVRIAQCIGLHRDGEKFCISPFDVQMRRRLFYQLIPLDGVASQMSGTGIAIMPDTWDTKRPLNINDDQVWPGMTETPEEQKGASDMIFCLARSTIGLFMAKAGKSKGADTRQGKNIKELELVIDKAESEVEQNYIRYCDIINPLHFLTMVSARSAITSMRIRIRLPKLANPTVTDAERRELFYLAQRIIDTDTAAYAQMSLRKYSWHMRSFFLWGSWDSLIIILTSLQRADMLPAGERDGTWSRIEQVYKNHSELLKWKRALHMAVGRLTLKAWELNLSTSNVPEPDFITSLRSLQVGNIENPRAERQDSNATTLEPTLVTPSPIDPALTNDAKAVFGNLSDFTDVDLGNDFDFDTVDWSFWEQLIQDHQAQGS